MNTFQRHPGKGALKKKWKFRKFLERFRRERILKIFSLIFSFENKFDQFRLNWGSMSEQPEEKRDIDAEHAKAHQLVAFYFWLFLVTLAHFNKAK